MASIDIEISDIVNGEKSTANKPKGEWVGTGHFDKLINAVNGNLEIQFDEGRIKGTDYANVYLSSLQSALQLALQIEVEEKKLKLSKIPSTLKA